MSRFVHIGCWLVLALVSGVESIRATPLVVRLENAPPSGSLVFQVYDSANAFGDFRDPARQITLDARGDGDYELGEVSPGEIAVLVYVDANGNGLIDKNFIGIPTEPLGLSSGYRPKGPPAFEKASFRLDGIETRVIEIEIERLLGERGRLGVGVGAIGRSSPYVDSTEDVLRVIPAITYSGKRLQWFGPTLRYGILGSGKLRLALIAGYRVGVYEEADSPVLAGLGDREDILLAGLGLEYEMPGGLDLSFGYEHDVLDRIGGGEAMVELSKGFQRGIVRLQPQISAQYSSGDLANHDFGVPVAAAGPGRAPYELGGVWSYEVGLGGFVELTDSWRIAGSAGVEFLDDEVSGSPIVADDSAINTFLAAVYVF